MLQVTTLSNQVIVVMVTEDRVGTVSDVFHYQSVVMLARNWPLWQFVVYYFTCIFHACMYTNPSLVCLSIEEHYGFVVVFTTAITCLFLWMCECVCVCVCVYVCVCVCICVCVCVYSYVHVHFLPPAKFA